MNDFGFSHFAQKNPQAPALLDPLGRSWTRGELFSLTNRISRALLAENLQPGDAVGIASPNCAEYLATYLAATQIGLHIVPMNWHFAEAELRYILKDSEAKVLFTHARLGPATLGALRAAESQARNMIVIGTEGDVPTGFTHFEAFIAGHSDAPVESAALGRTLVYTSATTGRPKGIRLSLSDARPALARTVQLHLSVGIALESDHVHLCGSMLYHAAPLEAAIIALQMGHRLIIVDRWEPESMLKLIDEQRVTTAFLVPTTFLRMLKLPQATRDKYSVASIRRVVHSGAPCPKEGKQQMIDWWGPVFWDTYGAAEGAGTVVSSEEWLAYPGTVGRPIAGTQLKIVSDDDQELPVGEVGTIYMTRYTGDRFEYKGDPAKTEAAYRGDFFTVGDTGYVNDQGYLFLCDRKIDMIIAGGLKIYPAEIEQVLVLHPKVADCAVFGVPDDVLGETVHAVIQPERGVTATAELTADLQAFLSKKVSSVKQPRRFEYAVSLPRDPTGKLFKRQLRANYLARVQARATPTG